MSEREDKMGPPDSILRRPLLNFRMVLSSFCSVFNTFCVFTPFRGYPHLILGWPSNQIGAALTSLKSSFRSEALVYILSVEGSERKPPKNGVRAALK